MTGKLLPVLSLAAAVLACVIVVELASNASSPPVLRHAAGVANPGLALQPADSAATQVAVLLARPLFSPDRKPEAVQGSDDPSLPHLTGIVVTGQDRKAIFAGRGGGRGTVAGPGDQVGAYRVQAIEATQVTLTGADGPHIVHPTFSTAAQPGPIAQPPMPLLQLPPPPAIMPGTLATPGSGSLR